MDRAIRRLEFLTGGDDELGLAVIEWAWRHRGRGASPGSRFEALTRVSPEAVAKIAALRLWEAEAGERRRAE